MVDQPRMPKPVALKKKLDSYDEKILQKLALDGRISWRELAENVHLSQTPTLRRVRRLEVDKYITGYAAVLNEEKIFGTTSFALMIAVDPTYEVSIEEKILTIPQVIFCAMYDEAKYLCMICTVSISQAYEIVKIISAVDGLQELTLHPVIKTVARAVPFSNRQRNQSVTHLASRSRMRGCK